MAEGTTEVTEKHINWGGIVKGALIVGAAVVACVVVGSLAANLVGAAYAANTLGFGALVNGVVHTSLMAWSATAVFLAKIGVTGFFVNTLHFSTAAGAGLVHTGAAAGAAHAAAAAGVAHAATAAATTAAAGAAAPLTAGGIATTGAGLAAGGFAALKMAPTVMQAASSHPTLINAPVVYHDAVQHVAALDPNFNTGQHLPVEPGGNEQALAATKAQAADAANSTTQELAFKAGSHAATHSEYHPAPHKNWSAQFANRAPATIEAKPREASYMAQVDKEQAASIGKEATVA